MASLPVAFPLLVSVIVLPGFHADKADVQRLRARHPDAYEYLPKGVMKRGQTSATLDEVLSKRVPPPSVPGMVVEPHFYFPAWSCGLEEPRSQLLMHTPSCSPVIVWTWAEKLGAAVSLFAGLLIAALALGGARQPIDRKPLASSPIAG